MEKETWLPIINHPLYEVNNTGLVKSNTKKHKGRLLKPMDNGNGYLYIKIRVGGKNKSFYIHRLVAQCFLLNPCSYIEVNHKDGIKSNNNVNNLEWCSRSENNIHAFKTGLKKCYDMRGSKNPRFRHGLRVSINVERQCAECDNTFIAKYETSLFCSKKCTGRAAVRKMNNKKLSLKSERIFAQYQT